MTGIQDRLATGKGKFTPLYPDLGTGPVSYEDSISPEFFEAEREAVFKRTWLYVGREERLPRPGTFFTRELPGRAGVDRRHPRPRRDRARLPQRLRPPRQQGRVAGAPARRRPSGSCRQFACKYHGWRYGLDGCVTHVTNEEEFFDLDKDSLGMPKVRLRGVRRVRLREPVGRPDAAADVPRRAHPRARGVPVREDDPALRLLHPDPRQLEARGRLRVRVVPPAVRPRPLHRPATSRRPRRWCRRWTRTTTTSSRRTSSPRCPARRRCRRASRGPRVRRTRDQRWVYKLFRAGLFGPDDVPDIGEQPDFLNKGAHPPRGATTSSGCSRTCRSRSGRGTTTSPTRTGRSRSTRTSTRSTSTSCRRPTPPTASPRSSWSTARSSSPCRT